MPAIAEIDLNEIAWTLFGPFIDGNQLTKSPAICYRMYLKSNLVNYQSSARDFSEEDSTERGAKKPRLDADKEESFWRHWQLFEDLKDDNTDADDRHFCDLHCSIEMASLSMPDPLSHLK